MIHVFFVPGMFGSTIEHVITNFTQEHTPVATDILFDGSMHDFKKQAHLTNLDSIELFFLNKTTNAITTPIYPFKQAHLSDILKVFNQYRSDLDSCILIYASTVRDAELNLLFQYHKIATGSLQLGLDIFCGQNQHDITQWNTDYQHWSQMQPWQLREWFSLFYVDWIAEWIESCRDVDQNFYKITNGKILTNPELAFSELINHCGLTPTGDLAYFAQHWASKQMYILQEFELIDQIVINTVNNMEFCWAPINIIAESIVQQRLRALGFEIRCDGLNIFPTSAKILYNLLESCYT